MAELQDAQAEWCLAVSQRRSEVQALTCYTFTDDFFVAIRSLYVARARQSELERLSFVLIGVATPSELIRDVKRTPFNIGQRVEMTDFTLEEALPLSKGLPLPVKEASQLLSWILDWTGGHSYLTQRLCQAVANQGEVICSWKRTELSQLVKETFFGEKSVQDNNLQFVRDMISRRAPDLLGVLTTYREIWYGRHPVMDEEHSVIKTHLTTQIHLSVSGDTLLRIIRATVL